jgi:hypothetical protein
MLTRFRIEVEEQTVAEAVEALTKYEHALQCAEAGRYDAQWPVELTFDPGEPLEAAPSKEAFTCWDKPLAEREWFNEELGREVTDEVIEFDPELPGYRGRRVVRLVRLDTRRDDVHFIKPTVGYFDFSISGVDSVGTNG